MKFAIVNGQRQEPQPKLSGGCPFCGRPMVAKCGEKLTWHWAHVRRSRCDPWWENETNWHRDWKDKFPREWQEIFHHADDGERHISDVKTADGRVIEFQHSYMMPEERRSREAFYAKLVWVVDGRRRPTDRTQFLKAWEQGKRVDANSRVRVVRPTKTAPLRDWVASEVTVFFDFGEEQEIWWLSNESDESLAYVAPFPRAEFIKLYWQSATQRARECEYYKEEYSGWVKRDQLRRAEAGALRRFLGIERGEDGKAPWSRDD